jgi:hypothetical protein
MGWKPGLSILLASIALAITPGRSADAGPESMTGEMERDEPILLWSSRVAVATPAPSRIVIEGSESDGRFVPHAVRIPDDGPAQTMKVPLPVGENLLDRLHARPFGSEERVEAERSQDWLIIRCGEGTAPAGVVLETGSFHFPRAAHLRLVVAGLGSGEQFGLSLVERGGDAPSPPQVLLDAKGGSLKLPPSRATDVPPSRQLVISCPSGPASLRLNSVALEPGLPSRQISNTGTWLWRADAWLQRPAKVEQWAVASQLDRTFLQLKIDKGEVAHSTALAEFVTQLDRRGISTHAVEGDPAMVTADGLGHALRRVAAIRRYQIASPPRARLAGLQFDIEPYLLSDFALDPTAIWAQWAETIQALSSAWGEPVSVVVPFWMLDSEAGAAAMAAVRPVISNLTVMAYRTEIGQVTALSEPWLAWGTLNGVPVSVALENGLLGAEVHRTFLRAETGSLLLSMAGRKATVSLFSHPAVRQNALAYAFHHETRVNPARISFMNNKDKLAVARAKLARLLVAWPSFDGLMIHALDETDRGFGGPRILLPEARANEPQASDSDLRRRPAAD